MLKWCQESEINPSKAQALWYTLNSKAVRQAIPAATFNGEVTEHTNSLRYPGIHFSKMLMHKAQVESRKLGYKKGLPALKAMTAKGIEQQHLFLFYQSVIISVSDCGLGLTSLSQSFWDLQPMDTRNMVEQVKAYLNVMQNPKNPLQNAAKDENRCRLARGKR